MTNKSKADELDRMFTSHLNIKIAESPECAPNYTKDWTMVRIIEAIVVKKGMASGESSIDFQLIDDKGNKYLAMASGSLLKALEKVITGAEARDGVERKDSTVH